MQSVDASVDAQIVPFDQFDGSIQTGVVPRNVVLFGCPGLGEQEVAGGKQRVTDNRRGLDQRDPGQTIGGRITHHVAEKAAAVQIAELRPENVDVTAGGGDRVGPSGRRARRRVTETFIVERDENHVAGQQVDAATADTGSADRDITGDVVQTTQG